MTIQGGCLCGQVRYQAADPTMTVICHCTHCQKQSGGAFSIMVVSPRESFTFEGPLKTYEDTGDSGAKVLRRFCATCGSPILTEGGEVAIIKAGTLDDTSGLKPTVQLYCDSAQPWVPLDTMKGFKKGFGSAKYEA